MRRTFIEGGRLVPASCLPRTWHAGRMKGFTSNLNTPQYTHSVDDILIDVDRNNNPGGVYVCVVELLLHHGGGRMSDGH